MKKESKEQKKSKMLVVLIQLLIGGVAGFFGGLFAVDKLFFEGWTKTGLILFVLFMFISFFLHINIHEFGHFIFGKISGYRLISYRVSIFTWNNQNGKMKFSIIKNKGYSGLCAMIPPEKKVPIYKQMLFYSGGILFNILSGVIFISILYVYPNLEQSPKLFFATLGGIGLLLGTINLVPFVTQNNPTDGKIIWSLILRKPFANELMEINKMSSQLSAGIRPRDIQISASIDSDNPQAFDMTIILFSYFKALDLNNLEDMIHYIDLLEENIEVFPHQALPSLYYELCYIACICGDVDKAKAYYEKGGKILQNDKDINGLRVKAYYEYYINKDLKAVAMFCENALMVADRFPIKGQGLMEKDLIKNLIELIKK